MRSLLCGRVRPEFDGELDWDQCCTVIDDLADYKVNALLFSGGEPLVHPRFMDLLERATGKRDESHHLHERHPHHAGIRRAVQGTGCGVCRHLSDGIGAVHDQFRGVEGSFDQAVRGFKLCSDVGQKTGLRLTLTRNNVQCMEQILDFIDANDIQRVCFYHLVPTGRGVEVQTLTREEARHAMDTLIARVEEWKAKGKNREVLTVTQPADGIYLLLRQLREGSPLAEETLKLLQWNGGGANSSGRGIANIDTQGMVHPDQFWQSVTLGNVKNNLFSDLWDAKAGAAAEMLPELRGSDDPLERQKK